MSGEEEHPQIGASAFGAPELETLKKLPADKRRLLVEELAMIAREQPETAEAAQRLIRELEPGDGEE